MIVKVDKDSVVEINQMITSYAQKPLIHLEHKLFMNKITRLPSYLLSQLSSPRSTNCLPVNNELLDYEIQFFGYWSSTLVISMKSMLDWRSHLLLEKCLKHVAHSRLLGIGHVYGIIGGSWLSGWCYGQHWSCCGRFGRFTRRGYDVNVEINLNIVVTIASATLAIQYSKNWKYWIIKKF